MGKIVFIKENSPEIRNKLKQSGFSICACAEFEDSIWLTYYPDENFPFDIHGEGYTDRGDWDEKYTPAERINMMLKEPSYFPKEKEFYNTVEQFLEKYGKNN